jgi:SAM-dependent methyltransferase
MVDALTEVHRLLRPGGVLIELHPIPERMLYEVRGGGKVVFTVPDPECYAEEYLSAEAALDEVVRRDLFTREETRHFDFFVVATSVSELRAHLREADAFSGEAGDPTEEEKQLDARLREAMRSAGPGARVVTHEVGRAARFRRVS